MYSKLTELIHWLTDDRVIPAISLAIGHENEMIYSCSAGKVYESDQTVTKTSMFDIASLTKVLTGICFMKLVEEGIVSLDTPIYHCFPEFQGKKPIEKDGKITGWCDASKITWYHALTHTSGMGWTREKTRPSLPHLNQGLDDIFSLPFAYQTGEHIVYSDILILLMGIAMEKMTGEKLDVLVNRMIIKPLGLKNTGYRRISKSLDKKLTVPTEEDTIFRNRRIWGEVHDENACLLDGVAGHAGIFSTAEDMCQLAMAYQACLKKDGILKTETVQEMIREQCEEDGDRRGLIWQLSGRSERAYTKYLSDKAYGHAGFTGCFLWNDPETNLSIAFLSNDVYNGREQRQLFSYRQEIMRRITEIEDWKRK